MLMPYEKFKNKPIEELPSSYLKWLAEKHNDEYKNENSICLAADKEYKLREKNGEHFEE
jgi:uncharacterized protein (DUF3820 family)